MAVIVQRTFSVYSPDKAISIANEDWCRPLGQGFIGWQSMRIAVLYSIVSSGGGDLVNAKLAVGLCNGTTHPFLDVACVNFVGVSPSSYVAGTGRTFAYNAGGYYNTGGNIYGLTKVSGVEAVVTGGNGGSFINFPATGRSAVIVDIAKGSPNYAITSSACSTTASWNMGYISQSCMMSSLGIANASVNPTPPGNMQTLLGAGAVAATEANGVFDTLNIAWSNPNYPLEIYGVVAARLS